MRKFTINDRFLYVYQHLPTIVPGCSRFPHRLLPLFGIALKPTRLPHRPLWISSNPPPQRLRLFWRESKKILDSNLKECNLKFQNEYFTKSRSEENIGETSGFCMFLLFVCWDLWLFLPVSIKCSASHQGNMVTYVPMVTRWYVNWNPTINGPIYG